MIDFSLTEEQVSFQDQVKKFVAKEIIPVAAELDEAAEFPRAILEKAWELGYLNLVIPEEYGGMGLKITDAVLIGEEVSTGCVGIGTSMLANDLALLPIVLAGNDEQKKKFLTPFTESLKLAAFCLTEPDAGSDAGNVSTSAVIEGDEVVINGTKCFITNGSHADLYTVFGNSEPGKGTRGLSAIVVPRDAGGITVGKVEKKMGQKASDTAMLHFDNVRVPVTNILGKKGEGFKIAMHTLEVSRPLVASASVGVGRAALDHAAKYANERVQFGKPIAALQAIQFMLADMAQKVYAARMMVWNAAWRIDQKKKATLESSIAKCYAADMAMEVTTDAVQIFGGYGYCKEYPVEKLMRDAKLLQIYEGTAQIQRLVIAREVLKNAQ